MRVYWTVESRIYHLDPRCPHLNRSNRYWPVSSGTVEKANSGRNPRRSCLSCGGMP